MTTRFSNLPGAHIGAGGYPSTLRRSNVIIGGPVVSNIGGPVISHVGGAPVIAGGLRRSTVIAGGAPFVSNIGAPSIIGGPSVIEGPNLRRSTVISKDQIPAGVDIVKMQRPA